MPSFSQLLITGGSGFLGWNLARYAAKEYDVYFTYHKHPLAIQGCQESYHLDLQNLNEIEEVVEDVQPEVIIHTAALANADACEQRRSIAHAINVKGTRRLAECAENVGARFIYISTDMVFDGNKGYYTEKNCAKPVNYYGETKLLGEKAVRGIVSDYVIIRMALMYGHGNERNGCFTDWIRGGLQHQQQILLFTDQYRTPLFVSEGGKAIFELLERGIRNEIFHLAGRERIARYDFGQKFCQTFNYPQKYLHPIKMREVETVAKRGDDCSLDTTKIQHLLSFQLSDVTTGLNKMQQQENR